MDEYAVEYIIWPNNVFCTSKKKMHNKLDIVRDLQREILVKV